MAVYRSYSNSYSNSDSNSDSNSYSNSGSRKCTTEGKPPSRTPEGQQPREVPVSSSTFAARCSMMLSVVAIARGKGNRSGTLEVRPWVLIHVITVGEALPVNSSSLDSLSPMSTKGRRTSAVMSPCFDTSGSYFSMYIRTVAPTEPVSVRATGPVRSEIVSFELGGLVTDDTQEKRAHTHTHTHFTHAHFAASN